MKCPDCAGFSLHVKETRTVGESIYRRRSCRACGTEWWTEEVTVPCIPKGVHQQADYENYARRAIKSRSASP